VYGDEDTLLVTFDRAHQPELVLDLRNYGFPRDVAKKESVLYLSFRSPQAYGVLVAIDAETGALRWRTDSVAVMARGMAFVDGWILTARADSLSVLSGADGHLVKTIPVRRDREAPIGGVYAENGTLQVATWREYIGFAVE